MTVTPCAARRRDGGLEVLDLPVGEPRRRLVEQEELRAKRQGPGDLEAALVAERQVLRLLLRVVGEADEVEQRPRLAEDASLLAHGARQPEERLEQRAPVAACESRTSTFSSTVIRPNSSVFWKVRAMPRRARTWLAEPADPVCPRTRSPHAVGA